MVQKDFSAKKVSTKKEISSGVLSKKFPICEYFSLEIPALGDITGCLARAGILN